MMTEDLSDCPTGLYLNFVYDYNIRREEVFKDNVRGLVLCVYDEDERLVLQREVSGSELSVYGYTLHLTEQELAPDHHYRIVALGMQKDWNNALQTPGAKYRCSPLSAGSTADRLNVTLDHFATRALSDYAYVPNTAPLDTLWHTLTTIVNSVPLRPETTRYHLRPDGTVDTNGQERISVVKGEPSYATVSLVRDTKHLNISLREINDTPAGNNVNADDYEVFIIDNNSQVDCNNNLSLKEDTIVYRPYEQWTSTFDGGENLVTDHVAHYDLMFNRLMYSPTPDENAVLYIRRKADGKNVAVINLPDILTDARTKYEFVYSNQEYLDREYDYRLEFFLKGDQWQYIAIYIGLVPWNMRWQNIELK